MSGGNPTRGKWWVRITGVQGSGQHSHKERSSYSEDGGFKGRWDYSDVGWGSMKGKKLTEGSQESGERDEGWRFGEGTWLDSGPSSGFGSGLEVPVKGRF